MPMSTAKLKKDVLKQLEQQPLSLGELAGRMGLKEKRVFRLLRSLFEGGEIASFRGEDGARKYRLLAPEEKKTKDEVEAEEVEVDEDEDDE